MRISEDDVNRIALACLERSKAALGLDDARKGAHGAIDLGIIAASMPTIECALSAATLAHYCAALLEEQAHGRKLTGSKAQRFANLAEYLRDTADRIDKVVLP